MNMLFDALRDWILTMGTTGAMARVRNGAGTATLQINVSDLVARGCAWVESGHGATAALGAGHVTVEAA